MEHILLIAGCSHAAGSEINGSEDSVYNRTHSFGNQLANLMGYRAVNIAQNGSANGSIARSIIQWFKENYDPDKMKVFVCVAWTESVRLEVPCERTMWYEGSSKATDWFDKTSRNFYRVNMGWEGFGAKEKEVFGYFQKFIAQNNTFIEIISANLVLQLQYFLNMHDIDYVMCNCMHMFTLPDSHLQIYCDLIDKSKYMDWNKNDESFFWKYRNAGYVNPKAKYWHHDEVPHKLYAERLFKFIGEKTCS